MADSPIDQIKARIDVVQEIGAVVELKRSGKSYKGLCPFHGEKTPSFYVFPETGTWRCFGCGEGGDIFTFLMKTQSLTFHDALSELADKAGIPIGFTDIEFSAGSTERREHLQKLREVNDAAALWYHHQLLAANEAAKARSYLQSRGVTNETIIKFRLGYAPEHGGAAQFLQEQGFANQLIIEAGLAHIKEETGFMAEYFRSRIMFPIRDSRGVIAFGGRELGGGTPKYLNSPQTPLFDKSATLYGLDTAREAVRKEDRIVIVEGYFDAIIAQQYNYRNTVACIGSAITAKHVEVIKKLTHKLTLALDPDSAGQMATLRAIEVAQEGFDRSLVPQHLAPAPEEPRMKGKKSAKNSPLPQSPIQFEEQVNAEITIMELPDGIDPDEYIRANPAAWQRQMSAAMPLIEFAIKNIMNAHDLRNSYERLKASHELLQAIAVMADPLKRDMYVRRIATEMQLQERDAINELNRLRRKYAAGVAQKRSQGSNSANNVANKYYDPDDTFVAETPRNDAISDRMRLGNTLEEQILSLIINYPVIAQEIYVIIEVNDFEGTETRALFSLILQASGRQDSDSTASALIESSPVLVDVYERLKSMHTVQQTQDSALLARTAKQLALRLKKVRLTEAINQISVLQHEAAAQNDFDSVQVLREKSFMLLAKRKLIDDEALLQT